MRLVLLSLFSKEDNSGGLAVYDLDNSSAKYVQLVDFSNLPGRFCYIRGVHWLADRLYAVSPFALFLFRPGQNRKDPALILEKSVLLKEWILGWGQQGNLHAVHASAETNRVSVSFNTQGAIDTFDLQGNFVGRKYLWEIVPDYFPLPDRVPEKKMFRFGVVRHIFEDPKYGLVLTTSFVNESGKGALLAGDSGGILLELPFNPHGSLVHQKILYLTDIDNGLIHTYHWPVQAHSTFSDSARSFRPVADESLWPNSVQNVRGMTVLHDRLICGVCHFGKVKPSQIPPRLVEFDLTTGKQQAEHFLPDFSGLQKAQVYAVTPVPLWLAEIVADSNEPRYFLGDKQFIPQDINDSSSTRTAGLISSEEIQTPELKQNTVPGSVGKKEEVAPSIVLEHVSLYFVRKAQSMFGLSKHLKKNRSYWALQDVSFVLHEGESVGVIGRNGSGKSSLSLVCAGVYKPDSGKVDIHGRVHLLALGVGFKLEMTGRENVFISASLLGLSRKEIQRLLPDIMEFTELGDFIDEPVRTYSSGMRSNLGFAVATAVGPEILILDETMSVGDKAFRDKAMARMRAMRENAKSVLIVSHNPDQLKKICTRVVWMEQGRMIMDGTPNHVLKAYENFCKNPKKWLERNEQQVCGNASYRNNTIR